MKKQFYLLSIVILGIIVIFGACKKEEMVKNTEDYSIYNVAVDENGVLMFKDFEEYNAIIEKLATINNDERLEWEKTIGFKSYLTLTHEALDELNSCEFETENNFYEFVDKYSDLFRISINEEG